MFTAKVTSVQDVEAVARAFVRHNNSPMEPLGGTYDRDTFAALDPKRFQVLVQMQQTPPAVQQTPAAPSPPAAVPPPPPPPAVGGGSEAAPVSGSGTAISFGRLSTGSGAASSGFDMSCPMSCPDSSGGGRRRCQRPGRHLHGVLSRYYQYLMDGVSGVSGWVGGALGRE